MSIEVESLKPKMKTLKTWRDIPTPCWLQAKADGEFVAVSLGSEGFWATNRYGTVYGGELPALKEARQALEALFPPKPLHLLAELFLPGKRLPDVVSTLRGGRWGDVCLGVFDAPRVADAPWPERIGWVARHLSTRHAYPLPYQEARSPDDVERLWRAWVEEGGFEGVVARVSETVYKVKRHATLDAVIIAVNRTKVFEERGEVASVRLAVMPSPGVFAEVGDVASGIDPETRKALANLLNYRVGVETGDAIYVKPIVVVEVEYTEAFPAAPQRLWTYPPLRLAGLCRIHSLRHPRLVAFRTDKKVNPDDIGADQFPGSGQRPTPKTQPGRAGRRSEESEQQVATGRHPCC